MRIQNLVQGSTNVVRIINLKRGDVYKRLHEVYTGKHELRFGVVTDVMNNGDTSAITTLEFEPGYGNVSSKAQVFGGGKDLDLFPATPEEIHQHIDNLQASINQKIEHLEQDIAEARNTRQMIQSVYSTALEQGLTAPEIEAEVS